MKLALLYTFWTGDNINMLVKSIKHHQEHIDKIVVCYQRMSNTGHYQLMMESKVKFSFAENNIEVVYFEPNLNFTTKENERNKHNEMIEVAKNFDCTHFILCAADHFYSDKVFEHGKHVMNTTNSDVILTKMRTYYKYFNWILDPIEDYYMPFITKLCHDTEITTCNKYPVLVDPSVKVSTTKIFYIADENYLMDHFSMVRKDIKKKFANAASSIRWKPEQVKTFISEYENAELGNEISYFQNRKLIYYDNDIIF